LGRKYRYPVIETPTDSLVVTDLSLDRMDGQIASWMNCIKIFRLTESIYGKTETGRDFRDCMHGLKNM